MASGEYFQLSLALAYRPSAEGREDSSVPCSHDQGFRINAPVDSKSSTFLETIVIP